MPTFDLFSKRRKRAAGEVPDVYTYEISEDLRIQIIHIWGDAIGRNNDENVRAVYQNIVEILRREYGVFALHADTHDPNNSNYAYTELCRFFVDPTGFKKTSATDKALDVIELTFRAIDSYTRNYEYLYRADANEIANAAIAELNARFKEHGIGYFYSDRTLGRIDSEFVHAEIVKPALLVLRQAAFASAQAEFLAAHQYYRSGMNSEALIEAYKAFESTMKIICTKRKWSFDKAKGAADLVKVCLDEGLIPPYWQTHFSGLRSVLESAISTPRNKQAGHGAGAQPVQTPPSELIAYVLHVTAATILFLTEAERNLP
jgi:hypothetical protein